MDSTIFAGATPWLTWGNTQNITVPADLFTNPNVHEQQVTLLRAAYGRPETWRFLFAARMLSAPVAGAGKQANASVWLELFTGIGRSAIRLPFWIFLAEWNWNNPLPVPSPNEVQWTTQAKSGDQTWITDETPQVTTTAPVLTDLIVGQDMTVVAHAVFNTDIVNPTPIVIEVSGQWAPNTHVRPDWMQVDAPPAEQFAGGEIKGR